MQLIRLVSLLLTFDLFYTLRLLFIYLFEAGRELLVSGLLPLNDIFDGVLNTVTLGVKVGLLLGNESAAACLLAFLLR